MPYFKDTEEMYSVYQVLFDRLSSHPEVGPALLESNLIVRFVVHDPEGIITVNCRQKPEEEGKFISFVMGESPLKPDLTFTCSSDFSHKFWHGKVNVVSSLLSGEAKAEGNVPQAMKLLPAIKPVYGLYPEILREMGRDDLIIE